MTLGLTKTERAIGIASNVVATSRTQRSRCRMDPHFSPSGHRGLAWSAALILRFIKTARWIGIGPFVLVAVLLLPPIPPAGSCACAQAVTAPQETPKTPLGPAVPTTDFPATSADPQLSVARIEELLAQTSNATDLDEEAKKKTSDLYRLAIEHLQRTEVLTNQRITNQQSIAAIKPRFDNLQAELGKQPATKTPDPKQPLTELEQELAQLEQQVKELKERRLNAENAFARRSERRKALRQRLLNNKQLVDEIPAKVAEATLTANSQPSVKAQQIELKSQQTMLMAEIPAMESELELLDAEDALDLPRIEREYLVQQSDWEESRLKSLQSIVQNKRVEQAREQTSEAKQAVVQESDPLLRAMAQRNVELAERYQDVVKRMKQSETELNESRELRDYWRKESENAKSKVESIGLTDAVGSMLRKQKLSLPSSRRFGTAISRRASEISAAQYAWLELEEERSAGLEKTLRTYYSDALSGLPEPVRKQAEGILNKRNELLTPLIRAQSGYFDTLVELSNTQQRIYDQLEKYRDFIDERILWVRSSKPLTDRESWDRNAIVSFQSADWQAALRTLVADLRIAPTLYIGFFLFAVVMTLAHRKLRARLLYLSDQAEKRSCISFLPTARALFLSIAMSLAAPTLLGFLSWRMHWAEGGDDLLRSISQGLWNVAIAYFPLALVRNTCRAHGLAESHFGWPASMLTSIRKGVRGLMIFGLPLAAASSILREQAGPAGSTALARILFIALMLVIAFDFARIFHRRKGAFRDTLVRQSTGWLSRLWPLFYLILVISPLALGLLSFQGYHFTARQLSWRLGQSVCLIGISVLITALLSRLLMVQRRKICVEQARQRRAATLQTEETGEQVPVRDEFLSLDDLLIQVSQSRRLLRAATTGLAIAGLWFIWIDIFPAVGFLEQWPLWRSSVQVSEMVTSDEGEVSYVARDIVDNVTIADLLLACLIGAATFVAARNIPGTLELSLLKKLPIESSVRYAITALVSYGIAMVGMLLAFRAIGVHWKHVQWLATALTFGLAFGLQEMFANFVAGIIILFEQPIRVGDIVTVDDVTGTVAKVRIRATTITNFDRKDYVVPNKDFITGRVLNWTLSDQVNRILIEVGVAYGSDTQKTVSVLEQIIEAHPKIAAEPLPQVIFEQFGDSSLNFVVRCFIAMEDMPSRMQIIHELHMQIDATFRAAGIEIAFPQRDIHVRSAPRKAAADLEPANDRDDPEARFKEEVARWGKSRNE